MARGRIEGNKVKVTGFTTNTATTVNKEEIYSVVVSGKSTADASSGSTVHSNKAVIKREKYAYIRLGEITQGEGLCSSATITVKNVQKDSLYLVGVPDFLSSFTIRKVNNENYVIELCCYPNYGNESFTGKIVIGGNDIYGHPVLSNEVQISGSSGIDTGDVRLFCICDGQEATGASVGPASTTFMISYEKSDNILPETLDVLAKSDSLTVSYFEKIDNFGDIVVSFPQNGNRKRANIYTIQIYGLNEFGDRVESNVFEIVQGRRGESSKFYLQGENIEHDQTTGFLNVFYPSTMTGIGVHSWSETITGCNYPGGSKVYIETEKNNGANEKPLSIRMTGTTEDGKTLYADGIIFQKPGAYLWFDDGTDATGITSMTETVRHYEQSFTFKYKYLNLNNISASGNTVFTENGGVISINRNKKTVTLAFMKNDGEHPREYEIIVRGYTSTGEVPPLKCNIIHRSSSSNEFMILYNGHTEYEFPYHINDENKFNLDISCPNDYERIGVYEITSTSSQYKIYGTNLIENSRSSYTLECWVYDNSGTTEALYTVTASGTTPDGKVVYTNDFKATHLPLATESFLEFNESGTTVSAESVSSTINFRYANLLYVYVDSCVADDGSSVEMSGMTYAGGTGSFVLNYTKNQKDVASTRKITVKIKGSDRNGNTVPTNPEDAKCIFILTQTGEQCGIKVVPSLVTVNYDELNVTGFTVTRSGGVVPLPPIYNDAIFSSAITDTSAVLLSANDSIEPVENKITFRGRTSSGQIVSADLTVRQQSAPARPNIKISSSVGIYDTGTSMYVVSLKAGKYPLNIECTDVDWDTLSGFTSRQDYATANTLSGKVELSEVTEGGGGGGSHENVTGSVVNETTVRVAVGNDSQKYTPKLATISKDVYEYWVKLDDYSGEDVTVDTEIWVKGDGYDGNQVQSNTIKFRQKGKIQQ